MKPLSALTDEEIDSLLLLMFNTGTKITTASVDELKRIRSKNHPDKWPNADIAAYQAAVEELGRRRK